MARITADRPEHELHQKLTIAHLEEATRRIKAHESQLTPEQWARLCTAVTALLCHVQHDCPL